MAESTTPLGGNTGWEDITIHCGGGLADPGSSDPGDVLPPLQLKGDFSFPADQSTSCPRQGKALIAFHTSVKNNVHYSLDCTNGHFSGVAQPVPKPGGGYVAPAVATFDIAKTTQVNCVLKSVAPGAPKVHVLKGHKYQCVRTTGTSGSDDLVPDTRPDPKKPEKPGKFVADPPRKPEGPKADKGKTDAPKLVCANGTVRGDACSCARTDKKVKIGKNAFRCVKSVVVDPVRPKDGTKTSGGRIKGDTKPEAKSDAKPPKLKGGARVPRILRRGSCSRAREAARKGSEKTMGRARSSAHGLSFGRPRDRRLRRPGGRGAGRGKGPAPRGKDGRFLLAPPGCGTSRGLPDSPARTAIRRLWHASRRTCPSGQAPRAGLHALQGLTQLSHPRRHS